MPAYNIFSGALPVSLLALPMVLVSGFYSCGERGSKANDDASDADATSIMLYIGSYATAEAPGIYLYEYDVSGNEFKKIQELDGNDNPSFLALSPHSGYLYAVNETDGYDEDGSGSVSSYSIDKETGVLSFINRRSSMGAHPCHISVFPDGRHVAVANYSGGNLAVLPVNADGSLGTAGSHIQHSGSGPVLSRQRSAHTHSVYPDNKGSWLFAADLGIDKVMAYPVGMDGKINEEQAPPEAKMEPGAGPRHLAVHPDGRWIYVINELNSTITRVEFEKTPGRLSALESVSTLPQDFNGENFCADIRIHKGGKFLYASNRGHNSIAIFEILNDGRIEIIGHESVRGEWPRNFNIDPSGEFLFVANQHSDNVNVFKIDTKTGRLTFTDNGLKIKQPVSIVFSDKKRTN